jgi:glycerophosphoryl diester phosphodiesterase
MVIKKIFSHSFFKRNESFRFPKLQSHRGFCVAGARENTLDSVKSAYEKKYAMVEFDVQMSSDLHVVLFHDSYYKKRIAKKSIAKSPLKQIVADNNVNTLHEVFTWYRKNKIKSFVLNIEIKSKSILHFKLEEQVLILIRRFKMEKNIIISSFNPFTLAYFNKKEPLIFRSMLLTMERKLQNNFFVKKGVFNFAAEPNALHLRYQDWDEKKWVHLTKSGIPIVLWTCNDVNKIRTFFDQGISSVITDLVLPEEIE